MLGPDGGGSLTVLSGVLDMVGTAGGNGVRASAAAEDVPNSPLYALGLASLELRPIVDIDLMINHRSQVLFVGAGNPINRSTVDFLGQSHRAQVHFLNETVPAFLSEHLHKFTVEGRPAIVDSNLFVMSDGANGSFVRALPKGAATGPEVATLPFLRAPYQLSKSDALARLHGHRQREPRRGDHGDDIPRSGTTG